MGGTSTDICLVHNGELRVTKEWSVEYGYLIIFPSIEVLTIGAGGGSLAWLDEAGSLRNGPQSAGAAPGRPATTPAARSRRTATPTSPSPTGQLAGRRCAKELRPDLAREAISGAIAQPLGLGFPSEEAAGAIVKVANANMSDAVRLVSIRRGLDPRDFALIAFGGAGCLARRGGRA